jgi:ferredoxin
MKYYCSVLFMFYFIQILSLYNEIIKLQSEVIVTCGACISACYVVTAQLISSYRNPSL